MKHLNRLYKNIKRMRAARHFARPFLSIVLGLSFLGLLPPSPAHADTVPVDLVLGGTGATPWVIADIQPDSGGIESVELHNAGSRDGFVTIWVSDIVSSEGLNPASETGNIAEPGELIDHLLLDVTADSLDTYINLPTRLSEFPQSYASGNSIEVIPVKSGDTVTIQWRWELPASTGNEAQGDIVSFTINYLLRECKITDVSGVTTGAGVFTSEVIAESDMGKGIIAINKDVVGQTSGGQPLSEIWLLEVDKEPLAEPEGRTVISLWELGPDGVTFDQPINLTLGYNDPEDIPPGTSEDDLAIALWDKNARRWVKLEGSIVDPVNNTISAQIGHFSRYAVTGPVTPPPLPPSSPGGGGDYYKPPPQPAKPLPPTIGGLPTTLLYINMLGQERTVEIGADGTLLQPLTLSDAEGYFIIELESGNKIIGPGAIPPERLELTIVEESIVALTNIELPENLVLLSPIYRLTGYIDDVEISPIYFGPSATIAIKYDATELPENILTPFIAYLASEKGLIPVEPPPGALVEVGKATGEITRTAQFLVAAELVPPPLPLPAEFQISNLGITPQRSRPGEPVTISISIDNRGESEGSYELYLQIDGIVKMIKKVTLTPKSSKEVTFQVSDLAGGVHEVKIGDLTGKFEIIRTITVPAKPSVNWLPLDLGTGSAVLIALAMLYLIRKRAREQSDKPQNVFMVRH